MCGFHPNPTVDLDGPVRQTRPAVVVVVQVACLRESACRAQHQAGPQECQGDVLPGVAARQRAAEALNIHSALAKREEVHQRAAAPGRPYASGIACESGHGVEPEAAESHCHRLRGEVRVARVHHRPTISCFSILLKNVQSR